MNDDQFLTWCDQWEKALDQGVFEDPDKGLEVCPKNGTENFFGFITEEKAVTSIREVDAQYWNDLYNLTKYYGPEAATNNYTEEIALDIKKYAKAMSGTANPIRPASVGKDQDLTNPISMGATYDVADLQSLETLKTKLHDLLVKLNSMEGRSQTGSTKLESQIKSLQDQIDELSDNLTRTGIPSQIGD